MGNERHGAVYATNSGGDSPTDEPIEVDGGRHLETVVDTDGRTLVAFLAEWCEPSRRLATVLEEIADEQSIAVATVDVERNQTLAARWGVSTVPTLVVLTGGTIVKTASGRIDVGDVRSMVGDTE